MLMLQATYWHAVLGYSGEKKHVRHEQVNDKIFVNCVAIALHRSAVQQMFKPIVRASTYSATKPRHQITQQFVRK